MKKLTVLCLDRSRSETVGALCALGLLHPAAAELAPVPAAPVHPGVKAAEAALRLIQSVPPDADAAGPPPPAADAAAFVQRAPDLEREWQALQEKAERLRSAYSRALPWGNAGPGLVRQFAAAGWFAALYPETARPDLPDEATCLTVTASDGTPAFLVLSRQPLPAGDSIPLQEQTAGEILESLHGLQEREAELTHLFKSFAGSAAFFQQYLTDARHSARLQELAAALPAHGPIAVITGFIPAEALFIIENAARQNGWATLAEDPGPGDSPPTLLRYSRLVAPVLAVFRAVSILPGYRETDPGGVFLAFFSLFFAMLMGDAGYGLLFLAALGGWRLFRKPAQPAVFRLLVLTSAATAVWGALSGTWFGIAPENHALAALRWDRLADPAFVMQFCFGLGALHLTVAHGWNLLQLFPQAAALAQLGWITLAWFMYALAGDWVAGVPMPAAAMPAAWAGLALVTLFMTPPARFRSEWYQHVMLPLSLVSHFVDVVSYLRLFAVGAASLAMAQAFNRMALDAGFETLGAGFLSALILFGGHALNITLGVMGVLVHGVRLNTLEFSAHLGLQWSGVPYDPLRPPGTPVPGAAAPIQQPSTT